MQPETRFKNRVAADLKAVPNIWFQKIQQLTIRGTPDYLICYRGKFFAWELKVGNNKATPLQAYNLDMISKAGGVARVVTPENYDECFKELLG